MLADTDNVMLLKKSHKSINNSANPLFYLLGQERSDHGEDGSEEDGLVDQVDSPNLQWKRVLW